MLCSRADVLALIELAEEQMLAQHFDLPQLADGNCGLACDNMFDLAEYLLPEAHLEEIHFTAHICADEERFRGGRLISSIPFFTYDEAPHNYYTKGCNWPGHIVFWIEGLAIDWTARQFVPDAPFPLLFTMPLPGR